MMNKRSTLFAFLVASAPATAFATITDFNNWTLAEDPPNANMSGSIDSANQVTLDATGAVPNATDIGYQSVDGNTPATSTAGYAFDPTADFAIAVDYFWGFNSHLGGAAIGFGIGEDGAGDNSAGVVQSSLNSNRAGSAGAARTSAEEIVLPIDLIGNDFGSFHIIYDASSGDITVGTGEPGDIAPDDSVTLPGATVYNVWNADGDDDLLIVSLFLRSDDTLGQPMLSGDTSVRFRDMRVITGNPVNVPEPSSLALLGLGGLLVGRRCRYSIFTIGQSN